MRDLVISPIPDTIPPNEEIVGVTVQDMEVGLKRSTTLTCSMFIKSVDGFRRSGFRSLTRPSPSHH